MEKNSADKLVGQQRKSVVKIQAPPLEAGKSEEKIKEIINTIKSESHVVLERLKSREEIEKSRSRLFELAVSNKAKSITSAPRLTSINEQIPDYTEDKQEEEATEKKGGKRGKKGDKASDKDGKDNKKSKDKKDGKKTKEENKESDKDDKDIKESTVDKGGKKPKGNIKESDKESKEKKGGKKAKEDSKQEVAEDDKDNESKDQKEKKRKKEKAPKEEPQPTEIVFPNKSSEEIKRDKEVEDILERTKSKLLEISKSMQVVSRTLLEPTEEQPKKKVKQSKWDKAPPKGKIIKVPSTLFRSVSESDEKLRSKSSVYGSRTKDLAISKSGSLADGSNASLWKRKSRSKYSFQDVARRAKARKLEQDIQDEYEEYWEEEDVIILLPTISNIVLGRRKQKGRESIEAAQISEKPFLKKPAKKGDKKSKKKETAELPAPELEIPKLADLLPPKPPDEPEKSEEEKMVETEKQTQKKAGKKGGKKKAGKKGKKPPKDLPDEVTEGKETVVKAEKKGEGKKDQAPKKKGKKEKAKSPMELERERIEAEAIAAAKAEEEKQRLLQEQLEAMERDRQEAVEHGIRMELLEYSNNLVQDLIDSNLKLIEKEHEEAQWKKFVECGRLPDPSKCDLMNTYLHLWDMEMADTTIDQAAQRTSDVLELMEELDYITNTAIADQLKALPNWRWIILLFREHLQECLDNATYNLLRNIEENLNRIDIPTATYNYVHKHFTLLINLKVQLPIPLPNPRRPPKPAINIDFKEIKVAVSLPQSITLEKQAIRVMYLKYDHLSDLSKTFAKPQTPEEYRINLREKMRKENRYKTMYKYKQITGNKDDIPEDQEIPDVPWQKLDPTPNEYLMLREDFIYENIRKSLRNPTADENIINLRKFCIIGGVYQVNLLQQPPQPLSLPKKLEEAPFYEKYTPPAAAEPGVRRLPEEIEAELKKQEEEFEKLILITLTWPEHVVFLELPIVCFWDNKENNWTKSDIYDLKHNEEKCNLTFRTGRFGTFGLASYKYANLPYQAWELKPEHDGSVTLQITAAILLLEFNVKESLICVSQIQNSPNKAFKPFIGKYFKLPKLIRILQNSGIDVFPAPDAFCFIENTCEKQWPMEKHLYYNMAQMSLHFNFAWSRWNQPAGRRNIVLQMREYILDRSKQKNHSMLHVTPFKATLVDCTEVSQTFNEQGVDNMAFFPDLFHLMKGYYGSTIASNCLDSSKFLVYALSSLLIATRVLSFS